MEDSQQGKRKRVVTACDTCRKSKIKCDGVVPQCSRCVRIKIDCVYTPVARKHNPPKRTKLIEGLEDRLNRIESFVMSDLVTENPDMKVVDQLHTAKRPYEHDGKTVQPTRSYPTRPAATFASAGERGSRPSNDTSTPRSDSTLLSPNALEGQATDLLNTDDQGQSQYIGSASGFSIFSPKGLAWITEKVGDAQFIKVISSATCDDQSWVRPEVFADLSSRKLHLRLPPKEETRELLNQYFHEFQLVCPLFYEASFMSLFETRFTQEYDEVHGSGWWASLNMVLAVTHFFRVLGDLTLQDEAERAWLYFKNAMAMLPDLLLRCPHILSVQALLAMAYYSEGASDIELSRFLGSAAVRISQNMGMHTESSGVQLSPAESQERRQVFWMGYILDKNTALRYGRPPNQDDDDMDTRLPLDKLPDGSSATLTTNSAFNRLFQSMCTLAKIEGKVYKHLYSVQASRKSVQEIIEAVDKLDRELGEWVQSVPEDFSPETPIKESSDILRLQIVNIHLTYYHCLAAIHRKLVQHGHWAIQPNPIVEDADTDELRQHVFSSAVLCVSAARASINLIRHIPQGNVGCIWMMLCYVVVSFLALCANIYQNPEDPKASIDLKLMKIVTNFLSLLRNDDTGASHHKLLEVCGEFERLARRAVAMAREKQTTDMVCNRTSLSSSASNNHATPTSVSGSARVDRFLASSEVSNPYGDRTGNGTPLQSRTISASGLPEDTTQRQSSLLYDPGSANMSQINGSGSGEMDFTNGTILPEFTGPAASSSEFWQLPMPLEWNWADMNASYFPVD